MMKLLSFTLVSLTPSLTLSFLTPTTPFSTPSLIHRHGVSNNNKFNRRHSSSLPSSSVSTEPQIFTTSSSTSPDLLTALQTATEKALQTLPPSTTSLSLAIITLSSLYDGGATPLNNVLPTFLSALSLPVDSVIGCTAGGVISSSSVLGNNVGDAEVEGVFGVSVTLAVLPDVSVRSFYVAKEDVPDETVPAGYLRAVTGLNEEWAGSEFLIVPSPGFQNELDGFVRGLSYAYPSSNIFGGIASTVSSLSRARLFKYNSGGEAEIFSNGVVGVALQGDITVRTMVAQGAKPVGSPYRIIAGEQSTIQAILSDPSESDPNAPPPSPTSLIPKPPLAEANYLMKTLSDDDRAFMRRAILLGVENGGAFGRSPGELERLAKGEGHRFTVHRVASAGMKDGSVTLPLGSVTVEKGQRCQFFVRDGEYAKREVEALWMGYKKISLEAALLLGGDEDEEEGAGSKGGSFTATGCLIFPTLDRGAKMFGVKNYETDVVREYLSGVPCVSGFYTNGVVGELGSMEGTPDAAGRGAMLHGSASLYVMFGSRTKRPTFVPNTKTKTTAIEQPTDENDTSSTENDTDDETSLSSTLFSSSTTSTPAPRLPNGELQIKRREVHSGRALTVSTVEWSVAEKIATPTSVLEGYMWDKETEVDRLRERVPLQNLVSQWKTATMSKTLPPVRDIAKILEEREFTIVPECHKTEPDRPSLRKRYDAATLASEFSRGGAPFISVTSDGVLFGGATPDITAARTAGCPVLANNLLLYPYQLYGLRLAGADGIILLVGAYTGDKETQKDLGYLVKIGKSLGFSIFLSVTSTTQIEIVNDMKLTPKSVDGLILSNRNLETFAFDESGEQVINLLESDALAVWREQFEGKKVLVEGHVGLVGDDDNKGDYVRLVKEKGADGCFMAGGLVHLNEEDGEDAYKKALEYLD